MRPMLNNLLTKYGNSFKKITRNYPKLVFEGDELLLKKEVTGYNIIPIEFSDVFTNNNPLVFYNNYIRRIDHFDLLLTKMIKEKIVLRHQIDLAVKASKTLYGGWKTDEHDESCEVITYSDNGVSHKLDVTTSVETIVKFTPSSLENASLIVNHLMNYTDSRLPTHILGSWEIPDIRASAVLVPALVDLGVGVTQVNANFQNYQGGQIIGLKLRSVFLPPWQQKTIAVNAGLAQYLSTYGVSP